MPLKPCALRKGWGVSEIGKQHFVSPLPGTPGLCDRGFPMISPFTHTDLSAARHYFKAHLSVGDYYSQKQAAIGQWFGKGAARLNLGENVSEEAFAALCEGNDPKYGKMADSSP